MNKGQSPEQKVKKVLKFLKLNENTISTILGGVVVVIIAGMIFNYFRTANLKTWQGILLEQSSPATTTAKQETDKETGVKKYKVVKGDDLWHIAEKHYKSGYNYVDIMKENKITGKGIIVPGQELVIPDVAPKKLTVAEPVLAQKVAGKSLGSIEVGEYTVIKGDTLWGIAVRAYGDGFKWTNVFWANKDHLNNPDIIEVGTKLTIPGLK